MEVLFSILKNYGVADKPIIVEYNMAFRIDYIPCNAFVRASGHTLFIQVFRIAAAAIIAGLATQRACTSLPKWERTI